jgi:nicotinate-nucleotide adenylyltransferase
MWFIPARQPPHKLLAPDVSFSHRLAMVNTAIADVPNFYSCDIEGQRDGASYSVDTLRQLSKKYPDHEFFFIMGFDSFCDLSLWKAYPRLFDYAHVVFAARPGFSRTFEELLPVAIAGRFWYDSDSKNLLCDTGFSLISGTDTSYDISSTEIRRLVAAQQDVAGLIPQSVLEYIRVHQLYL